MPTRDYARLDAGANYQKIFLPESEVPSNTRAPWGFWEGVLLQSPYVGHGSASYPHVPFQSSCPYCSEGREDHSTSENAVKAKFAEFTFHALR
jgi:hypothetical protein